MYYVFAKKVKFPWTLYHKVHWWNDIRFVISKQFITGSISSNPVLTKLMCSNIISLKHVSNEILEICMLEPFSLNRLLAK
jgi:hypothetical protein